MNWQAFLGAVFLGSGIVAQAEAGALPPIDAEQIQTGEWKFKLIQHEKEAGEWIYTVERDDDVIVIHDGSSLFPSIRESGTLVIDAKTYAPISISMDGDFNRQVIEAELTWEDGRVTGEYRRKAPGDRMKTVLAYDEAVPEGSIMRWSIFALLPGMPMDEGSEYMLKWFSVMSRSFADIKISVGGIETVETSAGTFETHKVTVDATPKNIAYITTSLPRRIVRVDVVGQDMYMERLPDSEAVDQD